jgi:hypothetical protein
MSALFFAVPLSVLIGALAVIRRDRSDRHCAALVPVQRTPENSMQGRARGRMDLARRRSQS